MFGEDGGWIMLSPLYIRESVRRFLNEDWHLGDISVPDVPEFHRVVRGEFIAKDEGILAGSIFAKYFYEEISRSVNIVWHVVDGEGFRIGDVLGYIEGPAYALLMVERAYLNLLQRLSGIATATYRFVSSLPPRFTLLDTRKTTPGLRLFEKYASWIGGATNHRLTLMDAVMIKDNHIMVFGSITRAVEVIRGYVPYTAKIEVECETPDMVLEAAGLGVDIIMLDNMSDEDILRSIEIVRDVSPSTVIEISGGITPERVKGLASHGVKDVYISSSSPVTKSTWLDISFEVMER